LITHLRKDIVKYDYTTFACCLHFGSGESSAGGLPRRTIRPAGRRGLEQNSQPRPSPNPGRYLPIIYRPGESPTSASIISTHGPFDGVDAGAYFANLAQIHYEIVYFYESEGAQAKSDADLLFEIALILAHIVLRFSMFNNLFMVVLNQGKYPGLGNLRMADLAHV
jgi:hypothetical protein